MDQDEFEYLQKTKYKCDQCEKAYESKTYLALHMAVHNKIKPFKC